MLDNNHQKWRSVSPALLLGVVTALVLVAFDPAAVATFESPKRLVAMLGIAATCVAAVIAPVPLRIDRRAAWLAVGTLALAGLGAVLSPRPDVALDAIRTMVVFAALPVLCASIPSAWRFVANGFVAGALVNAAVSVVQWSGLAQPFRYATSGGNAETSALIGNTGLLGLVLAFAAVILLPRWRVPNVQAMLVVLLLALVVNASVTGVLAFVAAALWYANRRVAVIAFAIAVVAGGVFAITRGVTAVNSALTFRLGPWAAAGEMVFARPVAGFGAGTYGAEYVPSFLTAEERWGADLSNPGFAGSYTEAHNDFLQALAELGVPAAALLALVAALAFRRSRDPLLVAGLVAALAWFPFQRPVTAIVLLAAIGSALASPNGKRSIGATIFVGLAIACATFEIPRYVRRTYPGDWRPLHDAAAAHFRRGDYAKAAELFERANALGERPEIDMNLALTLDHLGDHERAAQLRERAIRVAPIFSAKPLPARSPNPSSRRDTSR